MLPRLIALLLTSALACLAGPPADLSQKTDLKELNVGVTDRTIRLSLVIFSERDFSFLVIDNAGGNDTAKFPDLSSAMTANGCTAGCNGGFFSSKPFDPVGGMISRGVKVSRVNHHNWMKGALVVRAGLPSLEEVESIESTEGISDLLQSGTWLVRNGLAETDNSRRQIARRTFIGYDILGRWILGASSPCTLHELAAALRTEKVGAVINLHAALNFDGGPSTGLWLKQAPDNFYIQELWPVRNYVGIIPQNRP